MTLNYEKTLDNLDDILEKLQSQELSLDESIDEFEKAVKLYKELNKKLSEAKMKIKKIEIDDLNLSKEIDYDIEDNDFETIDSFKDFGEARDDDLDYDDDEY